MEVEYKQIDDFPGYRFGNDGSVWTCWKTTSVGKIGESGFYSYQSDKWRRLVGCPDKNGYLRVKIKYPDGTRKATKIHRLILTAFIGKPLHQEVLQAFGRK